VVDGQYGTMPHPPFGPASTAPDTELHGSRDLKNGPPGVAWKDANQINAACELIPTTSVRSVACNVNADDAVVPEFTTPNCTAI